jgi:WD40 repeat protein
VVLLLDSFDEMGVAQAGRSVEEQFRQLARPTASAGRTARGNRILITSRSHFFRDTKSARRAAEGNDELFEPDSPLGKAARAFDATIDTLPVFTKEQITEYLHKRLGTIEGDKAERFIEETYGLPEIASTPQLLDMIVASLPDLMKQGDKVTTASLYLTYTNRWLNTVRLSQGEVNPEHMRELLERMACELWSRPKNEIHYADLAALLRKEQMLNRNIDSERVDLEIRTAAFLVRSSDGYYRFSHKSFLEFFFARALFRALKDDRFAEALVFGRINEEAMNFFLELVESEKDTPDKLTVAIRTILENPYRTTVSENALLMGYNTAYHRTNIDFHDLNEHENLNIFFHEQKKIIPTNAQLEGVDLSGKDLFALYIENSNLVDANFKGATLSHACFNESCLDNTNFDDAELDHATMINSSLINASAERVYGYCLNLTRTKCNTINFQGADLRFMNACFADFSNACLRLTRLADTDLEQAILTDADLSGATLPRATGYNNSQNLISTHKLSILGISGHGGSKVYCIFSYDSSRFITVGTDNTVRLWDASTGKEIYTLSGHVAPVNECAFSSDDLFILTASKDMTARLWNSITGEELQRFSGHTGAITHCAFSSDSTKALTSSKDKTVRIWDVSSGKELNRYNLNISNILSVSFPAEGPLIASKEQNNSVSIWKTNNNNTIYPIKTFEQGIISCSFINNSSILSIIAIYNNNKIAIIYDAKSNKALQVFEKNNLMYKVLVSPDASKILIYYLLGHAALIKTSSRKEIQKFENRTLGPFNTFSPDCSQILSINEDSSIHIINIIKKKIEHFFGCPRNNIMTFIFSQDSKILYTFDNQEIIRQWNISKGIEIAKIEIAVIRNSTLSSGFSKDTSRLATFDAYGNAIIWSTGDGRKLVQLREHEDVTISCAFSPNNTHLLTIDQYGIIKLWNYITGDKLWEKSSIDELHWNCTFSSDGGYILIANDNGKINLLDATSGEIIRTFDGHKENIKSCEFSSDGKKIISSSSDHTIRIWDITTGKELFEPLQTTNSSCVCNFSPDGSYIISAGETDTTTLIDAYTFKIIHQLKGNYSRINACAFAPDGSIVITTTEDGIIYLWDTYTGTELLAMTSSMFSWLSYSRIDNRWDGEGELTEQLRYVDEAEEPTDNPGWVPRNWVAADLPELKGLTPLPELIKLAGNK